MTRINPFMLPGIVILAFCLATMSYAQVATMSDADIPTLLPGETITIDGPSPNCPSNARCTDYTISCGDPTKMPDPSRGAVNIKLRVKVRTPSSGTVVGHITFQTGGLSKLYYSDPVSSGVSGLGMQSGGEQIIRDVLDANYRTYELKYTDQLGPWQNAQGAGYIEADCGTSVIIKFIDHQYVNPGQALCSTGNSHGSFAIMHGLYSKDLADVLNAVVFSGGPLPRWDIQAFGTTNSGGVFPMPETGPNPASPSGHEGFHGWDASHQPASSDYLVFDKLWYDPPCRQIPLLNLQSDAGPACKMVRAYLGDAFDDFPPNPQDIQKITSFSIPTPNNYKYQFPNLAMSFVHASEDLTNAQNQSWLYFNHVDAGKGKYSHTVTEKNGTGAAGLDHKVHAIYATDSGSQKVSSSLISTCKE